MQEIVFKPRDDASVLVVGDIILDQYLYGETNRISREAPVPVVRIKTIEERPGGAANAAVNVSSIGVPVTLLGITGDDGASHRLEQILVEQNVACHFVQQEGFPTIIKRRVLSQHQQLIRLDYENDTLKPDTGALFKRYEQLIESVDVVIFSDYAQGSLADVQQLIQLARKNNVQVLVDPRSENFDCYRHASILTPNREELETVVGSCSDTGQLIEKGTRLCRSLEIDALLVTLGEHGVMLLRDEHEPLQLGAETHEVYDVTGAGDTVIAVLAAAIACGYPVEQAMALANSAAGIVVEKLGATSVTLQELNDKKNDRSNASVIFDEQTALDAIRQARLRNEKIIMTNGCFDILHVGHVSYLKKARRLGDCLIVAVNDDLSVRKLKGDTRPVNTLQSRMSVLGALACVDMVVPFSEETPERLIALFEPDVLVKGGDYTEDQIPGAESVKEKGGQVIILPYEEGHSTSSLLDKIKG